MNRQSENTFQREGKRGGFMEFPKYSLVIPVFNEAENLRPLYNRIRPVIDTDRNNFEVIFVDDGSTDASSSIIKELAGQDRRIKLIGFKRNFGQTAAIASGFDFAGGEFVLTLDADLQNAPEDIPALITKLNEGYDVVSGWRKKRKDNFFLRVLPSYSANKIISLITGVNLHDYGCTLKAYRRTIVKEIKLYGEMHRFLPALAYWVGGRITEIPVKHQPRINGRSKYGLDRTFKVFLDLITIKFLMNYSTKPNYIFGGLGLVSLFMGLFSFCVVSYRALVLGRLEATPLLFMMVIFFVTAVQFILMGLLAEVLVRTHFESQNKPIYFIKEKVNL